MEPDRYQQNHTYFIVGLVGLLSSLSLFAFTAYLFPNLLLGWHYHIPSFILTTLAWLESDFELTNTAASWSILLFLLMAALIAAGVAYAASNYIDNQIHAEPSEKTILLTQNKKKVTESFSLSFRIVMIIILVFLTSELFQWLISTKPYY